MFFIEGIKVSGGQGRKRGALAEQACAPGSSGVPTPVKSAAEHCAGALQRGRCGRAGAAGQRSKLPKCGGATAVRSAPASQECAPKVRAIGNGSDSQRNCFKRCFLREGLGRRGAVLLCRIEPNCRLRCRSPAQAEQRGGGAAAPALFVGQQRQAGVAGQARLSHGLAGGDGEGAQQAAELQLLLRLCNGREGRGAEGSDGADGAYGWSI